MKVQIDRPDMDEGASLAPHASIANLLGTCQEKYLQEKIDVDTDGFNRSKHCSIGRAKRPRTNISTDEQMIECRGSKKPGYVCSWKGCDKVFSGRQPMLRHLAIHTGDRPYLCTQCSQRFRCASHLKRHERQHTRSKPYKCRYCQKDFIDHTNMIRHSVIKHSARPYECKVTGCLAAFTMERKLRQHLQEIHSIMASLANGRATQSTHFSYANTTKPTFPNLSPPGVTLNEEGNDKGKPRSESPNQDVGDKFSSTRCSQENASLPHKQEGHKWLIEPSHSKGETCTSTDEKGRGQDLADNDNLPISDLQHRNGESLSEGFSQSHHKQLASHAIASETGGIDYLKPLTGTNITYGRVRFNQNLTSTSIPIKGGDGSLFSCTRQTSLHGEHNNARIPEQDDQSQYEVSSPPLLIKLASPVQHPLYRNKENGVGLHFNATPRIVNQPHVLEADSNSSSLLCETGSHSTVTAVEGIMTEDTWNSKEMFREEHVSSPDSSHGGIYLLKKAATAMEVGKDTVKSKLQPDHTISDDTNKTNLRPQATFAPAIPKHVESAATAPSLRKSIQIIKNSSTNHPLGHTGEVTKALTMTICSPKTATIPVSAPAKSSSPKVHSIPAVSAPFLSFPMDGLQTAPSATPSISIIPSLMQPYRPPSTGPLPTSSSLDVGQPNTTTFSTRYVAQQVSNPQSEQNHRLMHLEIRNKEPPHQPVLNYQPQQQRFPQPNLLENQQAAEHLASPQATLIPIPLRYPPMTHSPSATFLVLQAQTVLASLQPVPKTQQIPSDLPLLLGLDRNHINPNSSLPHLTPLAYPRGPIIHPLQPLVHQQPFQNSGLIFPSYPLALAIVPQFHPYYPPAIEMPWSQWHSSA